jgi:imidazolonepropionase-like amidohydrolase
LWGIFAAETSREDSMKLLGLAMAALMATTTAASAQQTPAGAGVSPATTTTFVEAGRLLADPASGVVQRGKTLVIRGNQVVEVRDGFVGDASMGKIVDLRDAFVLPGLIDSHVHLTSQQNPNSRLEVVTQSDAAKAMVGARYARRTLMAGFTTVADLGASNQAIFALRDAVKSGDVPGPRIIAAGSSVSIHGGHGDANGFRDDVLHLLSPESVCSGVEDCMRAVRTQVRSGADIIKINATGGVLSNTAAGLAQQFTNPELAAIVGSAHRMGRQVTAHAHGVDGINAFLRAGGDSIEHGTYLDDQSIRLFKSERRLAGPDPAGWGFCGPDRVRSGQFLHLRPDGQGAGGRTQDAEHGAPRARGRGQDRLRHRLGRLGPRRQRPGVRASGPRRSDPARGDPGRHRQRRRTPAYRQ